VSANPPGYIAVIEPRFNGNIPSRPKHRNHSYFRGGILADAMGLGKTLSILASVVTDLKNARKFASAESHSPQTGATLIVVTSIRERLPIPTLSFGSKALTTNKRYWMSGLQS